MRTRRKWWFPGMRVLLPCGRLQLCGTWRSPLRRCGEDGGHVLGPLVGGEWLGGARCDVAARRADPIGSGWRLTCGASVSAFRAWLGRAAAMREDVWVGVCGEEHFAWAAFRRRGGWDWGLGVCAGGECRSLGGVREPWGVGLLAVGVCGLAGVVGGEGCSAGGSVAGLCGCLGGWGGPVSRGPGLRAMVGVCGLSGGEWGGRGRVEG